MWLELILVQVHKMKKIILLIFGLLFFASSFGVALAAEPDITIENGWITPANTAPVGTNVTIKYQVKNTPSNAKKIQIWISDANQDSLKEEDIATNKIDTYIWKTAPANSIVGAHTIAIKEVDASGATIGDVLHHSYTLTAATGGTPSDTDSPSADPANTAAVFDAGDLGEITFPQTKIHNLDELAVTTLDWLFGLLGGLAVVALIYSGIMYITAGPDTTKAETAKKNLLWAITGIVITLLSLVIVQWVNNLVRGGY